MKWKIVLLGVIVAFIASSPYIYGALQKKEGLVFLGRSVVNSADTYTHLANIISAKDGNLIFPNFYTPELKDPFILRPTYYLLGLIAKIINLTPLFAMHLGRFIFTVIFVYLLAEFVGFFVKDKYQRFITLLVAIFSSGVGVFVAEVFPSSIDLWVPEANTFFMLLESTHFVSTQVFILAFILLLFKYFKNLNKKYLLFSSLFASLTMIEHPYMAPFVLIFSLLLFFILPQKIKITGLIKNLLLYVILPLISVGLIYKLYYLIPAARLTLDQTVLPTPTVENVFYGYGLLLPFALLGFYISSLKERKNLSLSLWILLIFLLIYSPFPTQRRFLEGLHIPISILAGIGIFYLFKKIQSKFFKSIFALGLIIILPATNIYNLFKIIYSYQNDTQNNYIYYLDKDEMAGMEWLASNSKTNGVVLANQFLSNIIPGVAGRFVYHGHRFLTYKPELKLQLLNGFMKEEDDKFRREFLKKYGIDYIYFGKNDPYNKFLASIEKQKYLQKVWEKNGVTIFEVLSENL